MIKKVLLTISFVIVSVFVVYRAITYVKAEQIGSSPESGVTSRLKTISDALITLGHGSTAAGTWGDWGAMWNRIYSAATWTPSGSLTASICPAGKIFYLANSRTPQTCTGPCLSDADCVSGSCTTFYQDSDGDSYGNASVSTKRCGATYTGFVTNNLDCNDASTTIKTTNLTGGTITYADSSGLNPRSSPPYTNGYKIHTFTSSGTLSFSCPSAISTEYLVVAGGGGSNGAGGGGGGGYRTATGYAIMSGSPVTVTVGAGGAGGGTTCTTATAGGNSVYGSITSTGGGVGGNSWGGPGGNGGSGGGGGGYSAWLIYGGSGIAGEGYAGGSNGVTTSPYPGGGGGGAGGVGANGSGSTGGSGGIGKTSSISGVSTNYSGGGGAGLSAVGTGGSASYGGGSGNGNGIGNNGTANTGGGAGGGGGSIAIGCNASVGGGGVGGSGIVIVRYLDP